MTNRVPRSMVQQTVYDFFIDALRQIVSDIVTLLPKIILAVLVLAVAFLAIKVLNAVLGRLLKVVAFDELFKKLAQTELPFSISSLIIALMDVGILMIALLGIGNVFLEPQQTAFLGEVFAYGVRVVSVIAAVVFTFVIFSVLIGRVHIESRMRGYVIFILLILITVMIVDLTALSDATKQALVEGLSIGLGIAVGIFAVWFFFHDYLDKYLRIDKD